MSEGLREPRDLPRGFGPLGVRGSTRVPCRGQDDDDICGQSKQVASNGLGGAVRGVRTVGIIYLFLKGETPLSSRHVNKLLKKETTRLVQ